MRERQFHLLLQAALQGLNDVLHVHLLLCNDELVHQLHVAQLVSPQQHKELSADLLLIVISDQGLQAVVHPAGQRCIPLKTNSA